jgi:hypothetical protein
MQPMPTARRNHGRFRGILDPRRKLPAKNYDTRSLK